MATTASPIAQPSAAYTLHPPKMTFIKEVVESDDITTIPTTHAYNANSDEPPVSDPEDSIPIIDFSLLTSGTPHQRSKVIQDIGKACEEWGFFMLINHGLPESMMKSMIDACSGFFDLTEEEKREYEGKPVMDPIRCGTSVDGSVEKTYCWRDFLKVAVHPEFHSPNKPAGFSELLLEFCKRSREVTRELLKGISGSLGLEECHIEKAMNLESGLQIFAANLYPICPQPEIAMGIPPHSDHGLLTLLIQNEIDGLQLKHNGKWVNVNGIPNSFLVNTADHLEIFSNMKYKSVMHRAVVNSKATRISIAIPHGPSMDTVVSPAPEFVDGESHPPAYIPTKYEEYFELQQSKQFSGKRFLDLVRI